eukprot:267307_1
MLNFILQLVQFFDLSQYRSHIAPSFQRFPVLVNLQNMLWLLVLIISAYCTNAQTNAAKYCPGGDWIFCQKEETYVQTCSIGDSIESQATISYGYNDPDDASFLFYDVSKISKYTTFEFGCSNGRLGNPADGTKKKGCCYRKGPISYNYSTDASDWTFKGVYGDTWNTGGTSLVKYQIFGGTASFYRWINGEVTCNEDYFPYWAPYGQSHTEEKSNTCYQYTPRYQNSADYTPSAFVSCGDTNGGDCNGELVLNGDTMSLISFGSESNSVFTWAYSSDEHFVCDKTMFKDYHGESCKILNRTVFPTGEVLGNWKEVENCLGCTGLEYSITEGTTSQSKQATTSPWIKALGDVVSAGIKFLGIPLSTEISSAISDKVSPSYTYTSSHTCSAKCGNGTEAHWYMYQWVMNAQEYIGVDTKPFDIKACQFICNTEATPPKCPPGYCADFTCQTCVS